nr:MULTISPECIES: RHS repeat-associated core domain-containing protein [unclassified Streptococcus]
MTKDGVAVASSSYSYSLYGSTKNSTDTTGNPFAYNGEARDITGLDYLRARYYDSRAGTFLTEDSYAGQATDPLSQNRYAYVHNNPVNYTDPSGHFWNKLWKGAKKFGNNLWNGAKKLYHKVERFVGNLSNAGQNLASHSLNKLTEFISGGSRGGSQIQPARSFTRPSIGSQPHSTYDWVTGKAYQPHYTAVNRWQEARVSGLSTHHWGTSQTREAQHIDRNWTKALEETIRHVCNPRTTKARDKGSTPKPISFGGGGVASWDGTSSTSNQAQKSSKKGHAFDPSGLKNLSSGNIQALAGVAGVLAGLLGGPVAGFATYGAVSSGLTSYSNGDKPFDVAMNTAGGALQGYFVGKYVEAVYIAASGAVAGSGVILNQPKQAEKPYGSQPANGPLEPLKPYGPQPASGNLEPLKPLPNLENMTRVGRWMSPEEYAKMVETGKVQVSPNGDRTFVSNPADIEAFQSAPKGSVYIEFDVDKNYIFQAGQKNWGQIVAPGSKFDRLLEKRGIPILDEMLDAYNIEKIGEK